MGLTSASLARFRSAATGSLVAVFSERLAAYGELVTFGTSAPVRVLVASGDYTRALVEGGFADEGNVRLRYLATDIPVPPALGSNATYQGRPYKVLRATLTPGSAIGEIELRPGRR